jgi:hypothetical protein
VVGEKLKSDVMVAQIVDIGIELAACIGIKIESYLQQLHQFKEDLLHVGGERVMAETIVVKIKKTERAAGFEHGIKVSDNFKALHPVVFEDETNPDQVKGAHFFKRMTEIVKPELNAGWVRVVLLRVLNSFFRVVDSEDLPTGLDHLIKDSGDLAGSAPCVQNMHARSHTAPTRLTSDGLRVRLEFETKGFFGILHQIGRFLLSH